MSFLNKLFGGKKQGHGTSVKDSEPVRSVEEALWQQVYDARSRLFELHFGALPNDILKMMDLTGVWPGGGLYVIPGKIEGEAGFIYTTFGLSNPDMPATVELVDTQPTSSDSNGSRAVGFSGTLRQKAKVRPRTDRPGYGYELIILAKENAEWPLWLLQWATKAEVVKDADLLAIVEKHQGFTVEQIGIGEGRFVNLLISKALAPLPDHFDLPTGRMELLVGTVITDDEMRWSMTNGRNNLLGELRKSGVGQVSVLERSSVVRIEEPDFAKVASLDQAKALEAKGQLAKLLMFPAEFGGEDVAMNVLYVPPRTVRQRTAHIQTLRAWIQEGAVNSLDVRPEYRDTSFVPSRIHMNASHSESGEQRTLTLDVW